MSSNPNLPAALNEDVNAQPISTSPAPAPETPAPESAPPLVAVAAPKTAVEKLNNRVTFSDLILLFAIENNLVSTNGTLEDLSLELCENILPRLEGVKAYFAIATIHRNIGKLIDMQLLARNRTLTEEGRNILANNASAIQTYLTGGKSAEQQPTDQAIEDQSMDIEDLLFLHCIEQERAHTGASIQRVLAAAFPYDKNSPVPQFKIDNSRAVAFRRLEALRKASYIASNEITPEGQKVLISIRTKLLDLLSSATEKESVGTSTEGPPAST